MQKCYSLVMVTIWLTQQQKKVAWTSLGGYEEDESQLVDVSVACMVAEVHHFGCVAHTKAELQMEGLKDFARLD